MTAMAMQMPSMPPPGPSPAPPSLRPGSSPAPPFSTQGLVSGLTTATRTPQAASPAAGASGLSLALPVATQQPAGPTTRTGSFVATQPGHLNASPAPAEIGLCRVKLADMIPEDGAPSAIYTRAVEALSLSLAKSNAAIIELSGEDATVLKWALEAARLYFRSRSQTAETSHTWNGSDSSKSSVYNPAPAQSAYCYRAGRSTTVEDSEPPPPCMPEAFRCLGKASRACLSAIARHLHLRSDVFCPLLDDFPLAPGEVSHSVLTAMSHHSAPNGKNFYGGDTFGGQDVEKGLLRLIAADSAGLQVCDPNGRWYLADNGLGPGDLVLLAGRALHHATAGLRRPSAFRVPPVLSSSPTGPSGASGRISITFCLMPRDSATIDCTPVSEAGHAIPEGFPPVLVSQFMDGLRAAEALMGNGSSKSMEPVKISAEPSLRNVLSDPLTGALLEDAKVAHCGHSFGGGTLRRVYETMSCISCGASVEVNSLIPNLALQAAARAFRREERDRGRPVQVGMQRGVKRKKELADIGDVKSPLSILPTQEPCSSPPEKDGTPRATKGVQYPFAVNERVMIKGNKRTAGKYVGREAIVTNKCLNGWYLVTMVDNSESVRLQYRSLAKTVGDLKNGMSDDQQDHSPAS